MSDQLQRGRFIWRDLITGNPDTAEAFYTNLLGWQAVPIDQGEAGIYRMLMQNGAPFGGIYGCRADRLGVVHHHPRSRSNAEADWRIRRNIGFRANGVAECWTL